MQRRATRWIQSDYSRATSVTSLLSYIDISTLEQRRQSSGLVLLHKIINNLLPISIPTHYQLQHTQFHTRQHHTNHFVLPQTTLNSYTHSFYPRTIKDWNNLPINVIEENTTIQHLPSFLIPSSINP